jgi:hypothetical protein
MIVIVGKSVIYILQEITIQLAGKFYTTLSMCLEYPGKLDGLIMIGFNETFITIATGKNLSDNFPLQNGLNKRDIVITIALELCFGIYHLCGPREPGRSEIEWNTSRFA